MVVLLHKIKSHFLFLFVVVCAQLLIFQFTFSRGQITPSLDLCLFLLVQLLLISISLYPKKFSDFPLLECKFGIYIQLILFFSKRKQCFITFVRISLFFDLLLGLVF